MKFTFYHFNFNVLDLERSLKFYDEALGLKPVREKTAADGSYKLVFLGDGETGFQLELTWLRDHPGPYALGENETHMCFTASDYEAAHALHQEMGCIVLENAAMGLYFIADPDGHWFEIVRPAKDA